MDREKNQVFISYNRQDIDVAMELVNYLKRNGYPVWIDNENVMAGDYVALSIESALDHSIDVICIITYKYLSSEWCKEERSNALYRQINDKDIRVLSLVFEDVEEKDIPLFLRSRLYIRYVQSRPHISFAKLAKGLATLPVTTANRRSFLPRRPSFIGRKEELTEVLRNLRLPRSWLTAIEGIAGIGKTTLSIEAAYCALQNNLFETAVFCSAKNSDLSLQDLIVTISETLSDETITLEKQEHLQRVRSFLGKIKTLIIIDNFETIKRDRVVISSFLSNLPEPSKAIITSRRFERLEASHVSLGQMLEADAIDLLKKEWESLYPKRRKSNLDFNLIQNRTGGNPQIMKMVIRRFRHGSSLDRIISILDKGKGEPYAFYEKLWSEMDRDSKASLLSLSVFAAPAFWLPLKATSGLSDEHLESAIEKLDEMYLVEISEEPGAFDRTYQLHSLTRRFAISKMSEQKQLQKEIQKRFIDHFLGIVAKHGGRRWDDYNSLEREQKNIFAAMEMLIKLQEWRAVVDIAMTVRHFVIRQDTVTLVSPNRLNEYFAQTLYVCEKGLAAAIKSESQQDQCRLLLELGNIQIIRGELESAKSHLQNCVEKCREIKYTKREIMALRRLAHIEARQGRFDSAGVLYNESLSTARKINDNVGISRALRALGDLSFEKNMLHEATELYQRSIEGIDINDDPVGIPRVARRIANIYHINNDFEGAARQFKSVIALYLRKHDLSGACYSLYALGRVQEDRAIMNDTLLCSLGCLRAIGFVHKNLWSSVMSKLDEIASQAPGEDVPALETYVPSVDATISLCFESIKRVSHNIGFPSFLKVKKSIIISRLTWEGEWVNLIDDILSSCKIY